ncbi:MAG: stage II sporulation protein M [Proteobacteria bacterium]|nr:stage II sporulation protein M [Pseudomonadota bacterium]
MSHPGERGRALAVSLLQHSAQWQAAQARAQRLAAGRTADAADATQLAQDYRTLAYDLARARALLPDSRTREYLERTYAQAHATLYRGAWHPLDSLLRLLREQLPRAVRWLLPYLAWSTTIFVLSALAGYALVRHYPELIALFASPELIASVEHGRLWTEGLLNVVPSAVLSVQILTNNIVVSLFAYCAGFLFGLGTLYILGLNGLMLGAVFAFTAQHALARPLLEFIVAHGCVELSVMCLSGAAGAAVGEALIRPGSQGRMESFRRAAARSGTVLFACTLLLIGAGLIEGYVSPDPRFSFTARIAIGAGYWLVMVLLLSGRLWPRQRQAARRIIE